MSISSIALIWFIVVSILTQVALDVDCLLVLLGKKTITWRCVEKYRWCAISLVSIVATAPISLAIHFIYYVP